MFPLGVSNGSRQTTAVLDRTMAFLLDGSGEQSAIIENLFQLAAASPGRPSCILVSATLLSARDLDMGSGWLIVSDGHLASSSVFRRLLGGDVSASRIFLLLPAGVAPGSEVDHHGFLTTGDHVEKYGTTIRSTSDGKDRPRPRDHCSDAPTSTFLLSLLLSRCVRRVRLTPPQEFSSRLHQLAAYNWTRIDPDRADESFVDAPTALTSSKIYHEYQLLMQRVFARNVV